MSIDLISDEEVARADAAIDREVAESLLETAIEYFGQFPLHKPPRQSEAVELVKEALAVLKGE